MFGYVLANVPELTKEEKRRYSAVYCGVCRKIRERSSHIARLGLSYDMAFLALLLMSLYEPEESTRSRACMLHPLRRRTESDCIQYAADMNVLLLYHKCMDDVRDEGKVLARQLAKYLEPALPGLEARYPRQCGAVKDCLQVLSRLEEENCPEPDAPAACFGQLLGELMVWQEDQWSPMLRQLGMALGRFIYLADAAVDFPGDKKKNRYNPFLAMGMERDRERFEEYLVLAMGRATDYFERLPLVQDKKLLDNILYSGIWVEYRRRQGRK